MQGGKDYIIQFAGLSLGQHKYEFEISDKFFESLDYSEIKQGRINVVLNLIKQSTMMILEFEIKGTVKMECDRCTGEFDMPLSGNYRLIVKVGGHETGDEDDDIITIAANEHELDLSQYLYEYVTLSLPIRRVHPEDKEGNSTCDQEMLKKLDDHIIGEEDKTDPRWDNLKNIKLN
jgi:uncharacterized metal-binding protein YceD (DUF177 family)